MPCQVKRLPVTRSSDLDRRVVGQAELPERHLEVGALRVVRVEVDGEEQEVVGRRRRLAVVEDAVVPGVVEGEVGEGLQRRVLAAEPVDQADVVA